jgi:hypothetical protein
VQVLIRIVTASPRWPLVILLWLWILTGCAGSPPLQEQDGDPQVVGECRMTEPGLPPVDQAGIGAAARAQVKGDATAGECQVARGTDGDRCFDLQPGRRIPCTKTVRLKKGKKKTVKTTRTTRCQPQSLIYARCRSGIDICRLGNTSPVQWYSCAMQQGAVSERPQAGSVIILAGNSRRNMPTGHPAYVEEVCPNIDGTWSLRLSHTNYDRRCNLDRDARVIFCPKTMTARFVTGPWSPWAKDLEVLGFILR